MPPVMHVKAVTGGFLGLNNLQKLRANPFAFLLDLAQSQGGIARFRLGPLGQFYLVSESDYIREILVRQSAKTVKWERLTRASNRVTTFNIVFLEGADWKSQRRLLTPAFHTQRVHAYLELIHDHALRLLKRWESGQVLDIRHVMAEVTMDIIGEILFGLQDIQQEAASLSRAIDTLLMQFTADATALLMMPSWLPTKQNAQGRQAKALMVTYLNDLIRQRRSGSSDDRDVLSALIAAKDAETGESLTDAQIRDELYSLFVAGHETTALWLSWTLYLLAKHPDIQEQVRSELSIAERDTLPSYKDANENSLLDRVLKETLRLYPPAWSLFMRRAVEDIQLGPDVIPKGGIVYISPYVQHHLPRCWANPDKFDPSRFEGDWKSRQPAYAFMPFGGGPRVCLGSYLAEVEARIILQAIVRQFEVSLADPNQEIFMDGGFTLRPYPGIRLRVHRRTEA